MIGYTKLNKINSLFNLFKIRNQTTLLNLRYRKHTTEDLSQMHNFYTQQTNDNPKIILNLKNEFNTEFGKSVATLKYVWPWILMLILTATITYVLFRRKTVVQLSYFTYPPSILSGALTRQKRNTLLTTQLAKQLEFGRFLASLS